MKIELPRYPAYEAAEDEWLSEMPVGWKAIQLARIKTKLTNGFVGPTRDILRERGVRYLQSLHIKGGRIIFDEPYYVSEQWSAAHAKSVLMIGDTLIVQTGDIGQVAVVTEEFAGCNCHALIIVSSKCRMIDGFFLSAVLRSHYGFHSLKSVQTGALHPHLNCTKIRDIYLPVPPVEDQRAILAFLDRETAKIDRLVEVRRKQINRLQEVRAGVIHHAVTAGLDPHTRKKPSGFFWLGDIPDGWRLFRLKFTARIKNGQDHKMVEAEDGYPVMGSGGQFAYASTYLHDGESVLFGRKGTINKPLYMNEKFWTVDTMFYTQIKEVIEPKFLYYCALCIPFEYYSTQTALPSMTQRDLGNHTLALPSRAEQRVIVTHIDRETAKLDTLIGKYRREVDLLAEYRASLISHAVTGKIDVRGFVSLAKPDEVEAA